MLFTMTLNDPVTQISRSRHYLTLNNISETVRDTDMIKTELLTETYALLKSVMSNDLE